MGDKGRYKSGYILQWKHVTAVVAAAADKTIMVQRVQNSVLLVWYWFFFFFFFLVSVLTGCWYFFLCARFDGLICLLACLRQAWRWRFKTACFPASWKASFRQRTRPRPSAGHRWSNKRRDRGKTNCRFCAVVVCIIGMLWEFRQNVCGFVARGYGWQRCFVTVVLCVQGFWGVVDDDEHFTGKDSVTANFAENLVFLYCFLWWVA